MDRGRRCKSEGVGKVGFLGFGNIYLFGKGVARDERENEKLADKKSKS